MNQERRNQIVELINQKRTIKNTELMERFGISIETVRRDLEYLEHQGCLQRVYGGAVLKTSLGSEPEYNSRSKDHADEKNAIAAAAARLVEPGDSVFLGVGTTVQAMAQYLKNIPNLTAFTNSLRTAPFQCQQGVFGDWRHHRSRSDRFSHRGSKAPSADDPKCGPSYRFSGFQQVWSTGHDQRMSPFLAGCGGNGSRDCPQISRTAGTGRGSGNPGRIIE